MNELIEVKVSNGKEVVSARELYLGLGLSKSQWSRWSNHNIKNNNYFKEGRDYESIEIYSFGNKTRDYEISLKMAKELINSQKTVSTKNKMDILKDLGIDKDISVLSRFEIHFKDDLIDFFKALGIKVEFQKSILDNKYILDFYIPRYNLVIEYDEDYHKYTRKYDIRRQNEIEEKMKCKFIRINYENSNAFNLGLILKEIYFI